MRRAAAGADKGTPGALGELYVELWFITIQ